jgi:hypothetical protein
VVGVGAADDTVTNSPVSWLVLCAFERFFSSHSLEHKYNLSHFHSKTSCRKCRSFDAVVIHIYCNLRINSIGS